jgi:hypothetical protein
MAGYSPTGTAKKLGIKGGSTLLLVHRPDDWPVPDLPPGATCEDWAHPGAEGVDLGGAVLIAFFSEAGDYHADIRALADVIFPDASLWVAWPRRAGGHVSDLTDSVIRDGALPLGLVDNKVAAIDADWSGLRFTWRVELRRRAPGDRAVRP